MAKNRNQQIGLRDDPATGGQDEDAQKAGNDQPPPAIDASKPDDELLLQFSIEAIDRGYSEEAAGKIAAGRLRHLRSGGDGYSTVDNPDPDPDAAAKDPDPAPGAGDAPPETETTGLIPLRHSGDVTGASHDGEQYVVGEDGFMYVLERHAAHFLSLGFQLPEG